MPDLPSSDLPLSDLSWSELLSHPRPFAAGAGSTGRQRVLREIRSELERRTRAIAGKMRMHSVLASDEDKERAIQHVVNQLLLPDIVEHMQRPSVRPETYVRTLLRRATVAILRERSKRHAKRLRPRDGQ